MRHPRTAPRLLAHLVVASPVALALVVGSAGCKAPKETWGDWMEARSVDSGAAPGRGSAATEASSMTGASAARLGAFVPLEPYEVGDGARVGAEFDLAMRNPDFPQTYVESVHLDLTGPNHWVRLKWVGPLAALGPVGPWPSSPGRGTPGCDCDDVEESNSLDSLCTPKGEFLVPGFADRLQSVPTCHYATWVVHAPRFIALHSHEVLPASPASHGCVRLPAEAAKLIHNNSRVGLTRIRIDGKWRRPRTR